MEAEKYLLPEDLKVEREFLHNRTTPCGLMRECAFSMFAYFLIIINMINTESLKKTIDFQKVYKTGKSIADKNIVVYVRKNGLNKNRLGISCSKKVGNSIVRHRFARVVREIYRLHENIFNSGLDIVVVARSRAKDAGYFEIEKSFLDLAGKSHLRKNDEVKNEEDTDIFD